MTRAAPPIVVKLSALDRLRGKLVAEGIKRAEARKRMGIPQKVVRLRDPVRR